MPLTVIPTFSDAFAGVRASHKLAKMHHCGCRIVGDLITVAQNTQREIRLLSIGSANISFVEQAHLKEDLTRHRHVAASQAIGRSSPDVIVPKVENTAIGEDYARTRLWGLLLSLHISASGGRPNAGLQYAAHVQLDQIRRRNNIVITIENLPPACHVRAHGSGVRQVSSLDRMPLKSLRVLTIASANELIRFCFVAWRLIDDQQPEVRAGETRQAVDCPAQDFFALVCGNNHGPEWMSWTDLLAWTGLLAWIEFLAARFGLVESLHC